MLQWSLLLPSIGETVAAAAVLFITVTFLAYSTVRGERISAGVVRVLFALIVPACALLFAHAFWWFVSLGLSVTIAALYFRPAHVRALTTRLADIWAQVQPITRAAIVVVALTILLRFTLAIACPPYDPDTLGYHLPMSAAYLQTHTAVPAQVMYDPGAGEALEAVTLGALGAAGGQALAEAVVVCALLISAYAFARTCGASVNVSALCSLAVCTIPVVSDQIFTSENDVLVCVLLLCAASLWAESSRICAIALGLLLATKFTGVPMGAVLAATLFVVYRRGLRIADVLVIGAIALPWYVRNLLEVGDPTFIRGQTAGFASTIAAHIGPAFRYVLTAVRNYGGLVTIVGALAVCDRRLYIGKPPIARAIPAMAGLGVCAWLVIPNSAFTTPGTLDQIMSGWSIRYALFSLALLNVAAVMWLADRSVWLAYAAVILSALFTLTRTYHATVKIDSGALVFAVPLLGVALCGYLAFSSRPALRYRAPAVIAFGTLLFALTAAAGAARISARWVSTYDGYSQELPTRVYALRVVRDSNVAGSIGLKPMALIGAHFERYVVANQAGLPTRLWWKHIESYQPRIVLASDGTYRKNSPLYGKPRVDELLLRSSGCYDQVYRDRLVRLYMASPHVALPVCLKTAEPAITGACTLVEPLQTICSSCRLRSCAAHPRKTRELNCCSVMTFRRRYTTLR